MALTVKRLRTLAIAAVIWNAFGLGAVLMDLWVAIADKGSLTPAQQALIDARPLWSVIASLVAVIGGTLGSLGLLLCRRWSTAVLFASFVGAVLQDLGLALTAATLSAVPLTVMLLQGLVLLVALALIALSRRAAQAGLLR